MMTRRYILLSCVVCLLGPGVSLGQTAYPMLMSIEPVASQLGATSEHTIQARYSMEGAYAILVSGTGVYGEVVMPSEESPADPNSQPKSGGPLAIRLRVDANALPGVRDVRVATPRGVSTVGQIVLVADPVVFEKKDNDQAAAAQLVDLPVTVCGRLEKVEDVDFYKFHVTAGQTICAEVNCMRLQDRLHDLQQHADPMLTIYDANGSVVAFSDNEQHGDPLICHTFDRAGEYTMEIRDVRFQGNGFWEYSVAINDRPLVVTSFPVAVAAADSSVENSASLELIGYGLTSPALAEVPLVATSGLGMHPTRIPAHTAGGGVVNLVYSDQQVMTESPDDKGTPAQAEAIHLPAGVNGRLEKAAEIDYFSFTATKGERYSFEVFARRVGSALDSHLRILDATGAQLQLNDDVRIGKRNYSDSRIENWTVPADGTYLLELRDLHLRGGQAFVYYIHAIRSEPGFSLYADTDKTPVAPGTNGVLFVRAERKNGFEGEIQLAVDNLPHGITAHCGRILAGKAEDGCIVFEAAADVMPSVAEIGIRGTATIARGDQKTRQITAKALVYQEIYQPGGGRGHWPVDSHVLAVTAAGDIRNVAVSSTQVRLKPGESQSIEIEVERAADFDKNVTLEVAYSHLNTVYGNSLPEGITLDARASSTLLTAGATKGKITFKASENAPPVEQQQIAVMANVSLNFVMKATYASPPIWISVSAPQ